MERFLSAHPNRCVNLRGYLDRREKLDLPGTVARPCHSHTWTWDSQAILSKPLKMENDRTLDTPHS